MPLTNNCWDKGGVQYTNIKKIMLMRVKNEQSLYNWTIVVDHKQCKCKTLETLVLFVLFVGFEGVVTIFLLNILIYFIHIHLPISSVTL